MSAYADRLAAAKDLASSLYSEGGPLDEDEVAEVAAAHSTLNHEAPWALNDLVEIESDLAEYVFAKGWSAEGIPVR